MLSILDIWGGSGNISDPQISWKNISRTEQ